MADVENLKKAITSERELLQLMLKLEEGELNALFGASAEFARRAAASAKAEEAREATKQKELEVELQKQKAEELQRDREEETRRHKLSLEEQTKQLKIKQEESRKNEEKRSEEVKKRIDYQKKVQLETARELERQKLEERKEFARLEEERRAKDEEAEERRIKREQQAAEEEMKLKERLIAHKLATKAQLEMEMADFHLEQKKREHELFFEDRAKTQLAIEKERLQSEVEKEKQRWQSFSDFFTGEKGKERLMNLGIFSSGLLLTYFTLRTIAPLARQGLRNYFFKPQLVSRSQRYSMLRSFLPVKRAPSVILSDQLQERMDRIVEGTRNTARRNGIFGHVLLHGVPGTGKTMFAEKLAREAHMDFAFMSGPSFDQFEPKDAIVEIKRLFQWANRSPHGLLLFIDECDSFLEDRNTLSTERVRVLNEFINLTGTESRKFMLAFETNRPDVLDPAVQSRITQSIAFPAPDEAEVQRILRQYVDRYLHEEEKSIKKLSLRYIVDYVTGRSHRIDASVITEDRIVNIAKTLTQNSFVGRDISNLCIALCQAAYATPDGVLTEDVVSRVVKEQIDKKEREKSFFESRQKQRQISMTDTRAQIQ